MSRPKGSLVDHVEGVGLGAEHRKSIMMFGGNHEVLHARFFRQTDKFICVEFDWIKLRRVLLVLGDRNLAAAHHPFSAVG